MDYLFKAIYVSSLIILGRMHTYLFKTQLGKIINFESDVGSDNQLQQDLLRLLRVALIGECCKNCLLHKFQIIKDLLQ